jgi:hypothetical protein
MTDTFFAKARPLKRLAVAAGPVILLSACGGGAAALDASATANYVDDFVFQKTGFRPVDVRCPAGVRATDGGQFTCHFTGPEGPYTAYLRIVKAQRHKAAFEVDTQPSSWPAPKLR